MDNRNGSKNGPGIAAPGELAGLVREAYMACYREYCNSPDYGHKSIPQYDGGETRSGRHYRQAIWPKIAARIAELEADPLTFVQVQFWYSPSGKPPLANMLLSDAAAARYQRHCAGRELQPARQLDAEMQTLRTEAIPLLQAGWPPERALRYALAQVEVPLSGLTRYMLAKTWGFTELQPAFFQRAVFEYAFQPEWLSRVWRQRIPTEIEVAARERRQQLGIGG